MNEQPKTITLRIILQLIFFVIIVPSLPLIISRRWDWQQAWFYALLTILGFIVSRRIAARRHPGLIAERARFMQQEDAKSWDKRLVLLISAFNLLALIVAGLDKLFSWSPAYSLSATILAAPLVLAGYLFSSWAIIENRFFSGMARLQSERGHQVISSGPYRWVRHPGYAGGLLTMLATPVLLGSAWAILPTLLLALVMLRRTQLEDRFLQEELPRYREYAQRVRYRLLPGVW
jgi:protein-S-isoprenylcysteine O-methyltransferase Ste14